jgi:hypothetical protein
VSLPPLSLFHVTDEERTGGLASYRTHHRMKGLDELVFEPILVDDVPSIPSLTVSIVASGFLIDASDSVEPWRASFVGRDAFAIKADSASTSLHPSSPTSADDDGSLPRSRSTSRQIRAQYDHPIGECRGDQAYRPACGVGRSRTPLDRSLCIQCTTR